MREHTSNMTKEIESNLNFKILEQNISNNNNYLQVK
jgi:hypothetical protein